MTEANKKEVKKMLLQDMYEAIFELEKAANQVERSGRLEFYRSMLYVLYQTETITTDEYTELVKSINASSKYYID